MSLTFIDSDYHYGFHVMRLKTIYETLQKGLSNNLYTMQIYLGNSRGYKTAEISLDDILKTRKLIQDNDIKLYTHSSLIHNPAGKVDPNDPSLEKIQRLVIQGMIAELDVMACFDSGIVVHIGSCKNREIGIKNIIHTLTCTLTESGKYTNNFAKGLKISPTSLIKKRLVILENGSGSGNKIGNNLDDIADIINGMPDHLKSRVKVCIDTAHTYGAGEYDFGDEKSVKKFYRDFEKKIGMDKLALFHLNDSRRSTKKARDGSYGSGKDCHEYLGKGYIFDENDKSRRKALKNFFLTIYEKGIPVIGEPPKNIENGKGELMDGPGGKREMKYVARLLKNTHHPLEC
jgi:deoxyribonuclease IV